MNKSELIQCVYQSGETVGMTKKQAEHAVYAVLTCFTDTLEKGGEVSIAGFGRMFVKQTKARWGRNPQTGEKIHIPPKNAVKFKPGKDLADAVNPK